MMRKNFFGYISVCLAGMLLCNSAFAVDAPKGKNITTCFATLDSAYSQVKENVEIENMPRIRSQGQFGLCFGFSAATIAQHYYCKENKINCTNIPLKKEFSPVSMAGLANIGEASASNGDYKLMLNGPGSNAIHNLIKHPYAPSESCYPFDKVAAKYPDTNDAPTIEGDTSGAAAFKKALTELEDQFNRSKRGETICKECLINTIQEKLLAQITLENLTAYLKDEDFDHFLFDITIYGADCKDSVKLRPAPDRMEFFPKEHQKVTPAETIAKAKKVLRKGYPINVDGLCPYRKNGECLGRHSLVLSGYRKMCSSTSGACRDVFKVHNSWGIEWQQRHNDGWVDAITLFGDEMQGTATLSWLE